jgi:hypothetical protein
MGAGSKATNAFPHNRTADDASRLVVPLATVSQARRPLVMRALLLARSAAGAMRRLLLPAALAPELADYPFDPRAANPWERDGAPLGL